MRKVSEQLAPNLSTTTLPKAPVYHNPIPVGVLLVPVIDTDQEGKCRIGVLSIRRSIPPNEGKLALPGGYIEYEDWQKAMRRELKEEAQIKLPVSSKISVFDAHSVNEGKTLLLFGVASPILLSDLKPFKPTAEASERVVLWAPDELAFPTHSQVLSKFLSAKLKDEFLKLFNDYCSVLKSLEMVAKNSSHLFPCESITSVNLVNKHGKNVSRFERAAKLIVRRQDPEETLELSWEPGASEIPWSNITVRVNASRLSDLEQVIKTLEVWKGLIDFGMIKHHSGNW